MQMTNQSLSYDKVQINLLVTKLMRMSVWAGDHVARWLIKTGWNMAPVIYFFFIFKERKGYNDFVFGWALVITYLIIHVCLRHHCNCYTSEIGPTPLSAASIRSYCYVNALSNVAYMLLPFADGWGVICGSCSVLQNHSTFSDPNLYPPQNKLLLLAE